MRGLQSAFGSLIAFAGLSACSSPSAKVATESESVELHAPLYEQSSPALTSTWYEPAGEKGMNNIEDKGFVLSSAIWPSPVIAVCWENDDALFATERQWVEQAVRSTWQTHSAVNFVGWGKCGAAAKGIRISVSEEGPHTKGLGKELDGKPNGMVLNFKFSSWSKACQSPSMRQSCIESIAVHEFGHALAFAHEQNRSDTPGECAILAQGTDGDRLLTPYCPESVMNYCNSKYNNDGQLAQCDITSVKVVYGEP